MPIKPIDLQTLFMQMEKVSKEQSQLKEGQAILRSVQGAEQLKREGDRVRSVREAHSSDEGSEKIGDRPDKGQGRQGEGRKREERDAADVEEAPVEPPLDPLVGRHIDIKG
jgi:hypothetical protein